MIAEPILTDRPLTSLLGGYGSAEFVASLPDMGTPYQLPRSGGWVLERPVPGTDRLDAIGPYPLLCCRDWGGLTDDLAEVGTRWVSLTAVADPLAEVDEEGLRRAFPDLALPFKRHWVVDLPRDAETFMHPNHRRKARRALERITVEEAASPAEWVDEFLRLFGVLRSRLGLKGVRAFTPETLTSQLTAPGASVWRARRDGHTVSMILWYVDGRRAWQHLGASDPRGYEVYASFGLFRASIEAFATRGLRALHLGGGVGTGEEEDGLGRFKRGWATGTRPAWLCGRVFDRETYAQLDTATLGTGPERYFPAYRRAEAGSWS